VSAELAPLDRRRGADGDSTQLDLDLGERLRAAGRVACSGTPRTRLAVPSRVVTEHARGSVDDSPSAAPRPVDTGAHTRQELGPPASELPTTPWPRVDADAHTRPDPGPGPEPGSPRVDADAHTRHGPAPAASAAVALGDLSDEQVVSRLQAIDRIERFTVLRRLGEGGMGIVSLAYDEELDRKVALKVIRQHFCDQPEHRRRFLREAQSLARLSHPNVVTIYDVGEFCGRPYLAMEYIDGCELRRWLHDARRSPREIRRVFNDAGRGLAAAHAAGLVHRDFKPANVLVGVDGRARVLDFGLSRTADVIADAGARPDRDALTVAGRIIGTPAYMSPEQLFGRPLDFRSDQYQFAIVLYEALVGVRPFAGKTVEDRRREGFTLTVPAHAGLTRSLQRTLQRALAERPEQRFATMDELLVALTADPWRRWRRVAVAVAIVGAAAGVAGLGYGLGGGNPCTAVAEQQAALWSPAARDAVRGALHPEGAPGVALVDHLAGRLDDYANTWATAHHGVCSAHHRGELSAVALDVRMHCLGQARHAFTALTEDLQQRGAVDLDAALVDADQLPELPPCLTLDARAPGPPPPPPDIAAEVDELRQRLAHAVRRPARGDTDAEIRAIAERARVLVYRPLAADALAALAAREAERAEYEAAARDLEASVWLTTTVDDPAQTAERMGHLLFILNDRIGRRDLVDRWLAHAAALIDRLGPDAYGTARLVGALGLVALRDERIDEALTELRRALAIAEALHGPDHVKVASFLGNLSVALSVARQSAEALQLLERTMVIFERSYGPDHISVITTIGNIAGVHMQLGDGARAIGLHQDALVRAIRGRGDDHPQVALILQNLGDARIKAGQLAQARGDLLRAREIQRDRLGPHRELHRSLSLLVDVELELGDLESARFHAGERLALVPLLYPADSPVMLEAFADAIDVELAAEDHAAALALAERGLARPLERCLREADDLVAYLRFHVARGLRRYGRDPRRIAELIAAAEPVLAAHPDIYPDELAELAEWRRPPARRR
jgi:tetratricopeptide (TPR) repeat protein/predicted Ser/Thr protein kinase